MSSSLPLRTLAASALLAGTSIAVAADAGKSPADDAEARIVVRRDAGEAAAPTADADAKAEPKERADRARDAAAPAGPGRGQGPGAEGSRPVDRLLEYVKKNHPDEYERLVTLRRENPEAFQQVLRRRFEEASARYREQGPDGRRTNAWRKAEGVDGRRPASPDRPDGEKRAAPAGERSDRPAAPRAAGRMNGADAALAEQMERVKGLVDEYHRAKGEAKDPLRRRIREQIGQAYELRERDRTARIRQMEEELARLKKEIESRRELRDQIIDRKVAEIVGEDPTAW